MLRTGARHPDAAASTSSDAVGTPAVAMASVPDAAPGGPQPPLPASPNKASAAPAPLHDDDDDSDDLQNLHATLAEYLQLEPKFQPRLYLPEGHEENEVSREARDGAAHVMRCLKVWFDLPTEVLMHAINLFDRFLTKMKVRPCHVPCITVSCMNIAIEHHAAAHRTARNVSVEELVSVSSTACTARDAARMSQVITDKLAGAGVHGALTPLQWARLFAAFVRRAARELRLPDRLAVCPDGELANLVEIAACDADCANARSSEIALVLLCHKLQCQFTEWDRAAARGGPALPDDACWLFDLIAQLQQACQMSEASLSGVHALVSRVLARYDARSAATHRQRLVWRLSERTLKVLRPTDRLTSLLPTIEEQHMAGDGTPQRHRQRSESESDTADWPRSPLLPLYCDR